MKFSRFSQLIWLVAILLMACVAAEESTLAASDNIPAVDKKPSMILTKEQEDKAKETGETFKFKTENGSDALDKIRFLSLTKKEALENNPDLKITIFADKERRTLTITDTGIGMTKEDLKANLGVIAKSGTSDFLNSMESNSTADMGLIGQFGVGFYSVFLIAESVVVVSKHNADKQHIWESTSEQDFTISEDTRGNTLGRGTQIIIHVKADALEYLEESTLEKLVKKYSEFINFPIYLWTSKTESEEVPDLDAEVDEAKGDDDEANQDESVEDVDDAAEKTPKTKTVTTTTEDWELMNINKPIWVRPSKDISNEEYNEFYQAFAKDSTDPLGWIHFHAEGELEFRSILFVPSKAPSSFLQKSEDSSKNIKLFVRKVFITDELLDFLPRYLAFLKGVIDSDDLPLNVSRETLQHSAMLRLMKKNVIRKAMEMFSNLSKDEEKWALFIAQYGTALKLGVIEDSGNRKKLSKLVRFHSSFHAKNLTSLDAYISRMKKGQPQIYVCSGSDLEEVKRSPFTEKLIGRGYEYLPDPIDEYFVQSLPEYDGKKIQSIAKAGLKYGDEDDDEKDSNEVMTEKFKPLSEYLLEILASSVEKVVLSNKLTKSPCAIVANEHGITGTMEKLMQAQALGGDDFMAKYYMGQKKIFEINPAHPIMEGLLERIEKGEGDQDNIKQTVRVLYESTLLRSGYQVPNTMDFANRIERVIRHFIGVDLEKEAVVDVKPAPEFTENEAKESKLDDDTDDTEREQNDNERLGENDNEEVEQENEESNAHDEL